MQLKKKTEQQEHSIKDLGQWLDKWKDIQPAQPQRDGFRTICWLGGLGVLLHPVFSWLSLNLWPLLVMDGFLILLAALIVWHERNATKN